MKPLQSSFPTLAVATVILTTSVVLAQAAPPAGTTGVCKDGTYTTAASKSGACRGHQGIKEWLAPAATPAASPAASASPAKSTADVTPAKPAKPATVTPAAPTASASTAASSSTAAAKTTTHASTATMAQAPGGGPGMVWFNSDSKVYHCSGSQFYGKTKQGSYMSEADAKAKGGHPDHNHPCTK
jgi:hypothetical protein